MLSAGRAIGQLSRITRHAHNLLKNSAPQNHLEFSKIVSLRYSSKSKKSRTTGSTAKVEECLPKEKAYKKVPPMPTPPPPPHAQPQTDIKPPEPRRALCDDKNYSCPPTCPPNHAEVCYKPGGPSGEEPGGFKYWKHLLAALIVSGLGVYGYLEYFSKKDQEDKKKEKCKSREICKNPSESGKIPPEIPYLLIGGGTAAFSAFRSIKSIEPTAKVLIINAEGDLPYMRPPLSKELWYNRDESSPEAAEKLMFRQWNGTKRSLFYEPKEFYTKITELANCKKGGVSVASGWSVKKVDVINKTAYLEDGYKIKFDKCLIATGGKPKNLKVFENADEKAKQRILPFRSNQDYHELMCNLKKPTTKNIVVVGGGFLGSELSTSIARNLICENQTVYQIFKEKNVMAQVLPEYLSEWTTKKTESQGVICMPELEVHDCQMNNNRLALTLSDGKVLEADQVIVAVGIEIDDKLAKESNLEVDSKLGGYLVNAELEARSNVWIAGDAACFYDVKLGRRRVEHHDHAVVSGRLAGENMTGARKPYLHQSMFWSDLGPEVGFEAIGIIDSTLETVGVFAKTSESEAEPSDETDKKDENEEDKKLKITEGSSEEKAEAISDENADEKPKTNMDEYGKGLIFYLRDNIVVGIALWNIFNRMSVARQILARGTTYEEIDEASKLFEIHED